METIGGNQLRRERARFRDDMQLSQVLFASEIPRFIRTRAIISNDRSVWLPSASASCMHSCGKYVEPVHWLGNAWSNEPLSMYERKKQRNRRLSARIFAKSL
ncbi:hypothetical protein K474DRAFT_237262 [Panus rudis PR-1116 ss-1]|nr:hypothetical protein K474DRAFT_237262 [Panus rudis PR-1116 ss-1]